MPTYEKLLPVQRKALADAIGLTTDKLQTAMWLQEATKDMSAEELDLTTKYGEQLGNITGLGKEQIIDRANHVQLTEQLTSSLEKISSSIMPTIISLATALTPILQAISFVVTQISNGFNLISNALNWVNDALKPIWPVLNAIKYVLVGVVALMAAAAIFATAMQGGLVGMAIGTAAVVAVIGGVGNMVSSKFDDMVMQPTSPAGYSRVLSGPEGSVALNDKDTIVAGTNLNSGKSSTDNSKLERLLQENNNLLRQSLNRPIIIGREAVNAIGNSIKVNESFG